MNRPLLAAALLAALLGTGCGGPEVEVIRARRGPIEEGFTEPARTRLVRTYPVAMPVAARIEPVTLREGDEVKKGEALARVDTTVLAQEIRELEASRAELRAELTKLGDHQLEMTLRKGAVDEVAASAKALEASREQVEAERLRFEQLERDHQRDQKLFEQKAITLKDYDKTKLDAQTARIDYRRQGFYTAALQALHTAVELGPKTIDDWLERQDHDAEVLRHKLEQVEAKLDRARYHLQLARLRSPIDGVVLEKHHEGGVVLAVGTRLLTLGRLEEIEVVSEVLSRDALRLKSGTPVTLEGSIPATVAEIEPQGFTKLSSLGVEQQRVIVRIAPEEPLPRQVGPGYRLEARFTTRHKDGALVLPRHSVLQSKERTHYLYRVVGGKLARTEVKVGLSGDLEVEILSGLSPEDQVVLHPEVSFVDGESVRPRSGEKDG